MFIVIKNYSVLQDELDNIGQHSSGDASSKAKGLFTNMEQFQTFLGLKLSYMAFVAIEQLAITLQSKKY